LRKVRQNIESTSGLVGIGTAKILANISLSPAFTAAIHASSSACKQSVARRNISRIIRRDENKTNRSVDGVRPASPGPRMSRQTRIL